MHNVTYKSKDGQPKTNVNNSEQRTNNRNQTSQVASNQIQAANPQNPKKTNKTKHYRQVQAPHNLVNTNSPQPATQVNTNSPRPVNKPLGPKENPFMCSLENSQKLVLQSILSKPYLIPGKNGAPDIQLKLLDYLRELQHRMPYAHIKLIGSAAGYVVCPQVQGYNDLDFVIEIQLPYDITKFPSKEHLQWQIQHQVADICNQTRAILETCLATQLRDEQTLIEIGNNYFNKQKVKNTPIDLNDIHSATDNRLSIIGFGDLEFKTVIHICTFQEDTRIGTIPGLKNPSAFDRDDIGISLTAYLNLPSFQWLDYPLCATSICIPIQVAIADLKSKELVTTRICGSKWIKGIDNITFKGCYYPKEETNRAIYTQFLEKPSSIEELYKHFSPYEKERLFGILCALSNFCINDANLSFNAESFKQTLVALASKYFPKIPGELLLKWCQLSLFLSAKPANHSPHVLSLIEGEHTYYLLTPKCPLDLLKDFMQELQKHPEISLKDLPILGIPFATEEELFSQMKPHLKEEEFISFTHCLLSRSPFALNADKDLEFNLLILLLESIKKLTSPKLRQELIQKTKECFELRNSNCVELFEQLSMRAPFEPLLMGTLFYTSITKLTSVNLDLAMRLWNYAEEKKVFAASPVEGLKAFASIHSKKLENKMNKIEKMATLTTAVQMVRDLNQTLVLENLNQLDSFDALLLNLVNELAKEDLSLEDLKSIQTLFAQITPLSLLTISLKKEMANTLVESFIASASTHPKKRQQAIINLLETIAKMYPKDDGKESLRLCIKYLKAVPGGSNHAHKHLRNLHFKSVLIEEMQAGTLESNIPWFALLNQQTLLSCNDQESWKCCGALLKQWGQSPSLAHYTAALGAFQLFNKADTSKDTSELKRFAANAYFNFIRGCLKNKDQKLMQNAEGILQNNALKKLIPDTHAALIADLISAQSKIELAEKHLTNAVKQQVFNANTRSSWIRALCGIINTHVESNSKKTIQFIESLLSDFSFLEMLLDPTTKNANDLIVAIIHNYGEIHSKVTLETILLLFKKMYENRKTNNDTLYDELIQYCTTVLFTNLVKNKLIDLKQWSELIDIVQYDKNIYKDNYELKQKTIGIGVRNCVSIVSKYIKAHYSIKSDYEKCIKVLSVFQSANKSPLLPEDLAHCQCEEVSALIYLKDISGAIEKLELIADPITRTKAIEQALAAFTHSDQDEILQNSKETIRLFEMLGELSDQIPSLDTFSLCIMSLINSASTDKPEAHYDLLVSLVNKYEALLKSHPEKFADLENAYFLFLYALHGRTLFYETMHRVFNTAKEVIKNPALIEEIQKKLIDTEKMLKVEIV